MKKEFEHFEHGADIGVRGFGKGLEEAFQNGAKALFSLMCPDLSKIPLEDSYEVEAASIDLTGLFVAYLNTLISLADMNSVLFSHFTCFIDKDRFMLKGKASGGRLTMDPSVRGIEVKGATFTEAVVKKEGDIYLAQCVVDV